MVRTSTTGRSLKNNEVNLIFKKIKVDKTPNTPSRHNQTKIKKAGVERVQRQLSGFTLTFSIIITIIDATDEGSNKSNLRLETKMERDS